MVKTKFDETMERHQRYKAHKVLAGIVMTTHGMSLDNARVVAIGTGTKCISNINHDEDGTILHDMHAEVLARRSFVRFLCQQLSAFQKSKLIGRIINNWLIRCLNPFFCNEFQKNLQYFNLKERKSN